MMKRLMSLLLCIAMLAGMLTVTAMAATDTTEKNDIYGTVGFFQVFDCQRNPTGGAVAGETQKAYHFYYPLIDGASTAITDEIPDAEDNPGNYEYLLEAAGENVKITLKHKTDSSISRVLVDNAQIAAYGESCFMLISEESDWGYFVDLATPHTIGGSKEFTVKAKIVDMNSGSVVTPPVTPVLPAEVRPGESYVLRTGLDRKTVKVDSYDFTTGTRGFNGASYIDEVKINKNGELVLTFKESFTLALEDPKAINGEIILLDKSTTPATKVPVSVTTGLNNTVNEIYGDRKAAEAEDVNGKWGKNTVMVMDDEGGYVKFSNELLNGVVKMNADEKTYLNLVYGSHAASAATPNTEDTIDAIEALLGEAYVEEAITEYYTFETRAFKNEVAFSYAAYQDDPHYFYLYKDGKLTAIDVKYNEDEEVEAWQWNAIAEGTIIVTDVEIVLADVEDKNPDTGANDLVGAAAVLAVVSLLAAGAVSLKK